MLNSLHCYWAIMSVVMVYIGASCCFYFKLKFLLQVFPIGECSHAVKRLFGNDWCFTCAVAPGKICLVSGNHPLFSCRVPSQRPDRRPIVVVRKRPIECRTGGAATQRCLGGNLAIYANFAIHCLTYLFQIL